MRESQTSEQRRRNYLAPSSPIKKTAAFFWFLCALKWETEFIAFTQDIFTSQKSPESISTYSLVYFNMFMFIWRKQLSRSKICVTVSSLVCRCDMMVMMAIHTLWPFRCLEVFSSYSPSDYFFRSYCVLSNSASRRLWFWYLVRQNTPIRNVSKKEVARTRLYYKLLRT